MLQIYNTYTQQKEIFKPLKEKHIGLYVCGMTVYDYCHIGHSRGWVFFDLMTRYLRARGYTVNYVRNITDIDDKIIKRAQENNETIEQLTERMIAYMHEDERALNILPVTQEPRATQYVTHMIDIIKTLIEKGLAYVASNGDVCYEIEKFADYGKLAHQDLENLRSGARVAITEGKHDPLDFVLWKMAKPGEPSWDSPWGAGRPGWHIECSAMSIDCLGEQFDIHGGGFDLIFPHHQNEIAQSEGYTGKKFVNTWMHVGFVQVDKEKMSKSLGNFFTVRDVLKEFSPEVVRYFLLASHYRSPINYSQENLQSAHSALERLYIALRDLPVTEIKSASSEYIDRFNQAMDDDFNTPEALAVMFDLARDINKVKDNDAVKAQQLAEQLRYLGSVLGILQQEPQQFLQGDIQQDETLEIEKLIAARLQARKEKNWTEADRVRQQLTSMGISLEDTADGTKWRRS